MGPSLLTPPPPLLSTGPPLLSDGDCLRECREEEVEGCLVPSEILLTEDNGQADPERRPLKEQVSENLQGVQIPHAKGGGLSE